MSERPSFRQALERLEAVVRELERSDVDLDRALALFEEGVRELREAGALLGGIPWSSPSYSPSLP